MTTRILLLLALFALSSGPFAADMKPDKSDGCGPGWYLYKDKTILGTSIRGTTNNVLPIQASGMTTGTSNCERHDIVMQSKEQQYFTERNYDSILYEMAIGQGEYLSEYAQLFGCEADSFGQMAQKNYSQIVPSADNSKELIKNIHRQIKSEKLNCAV